MNATSNQDNIQNARSHTKGMERDGANSSLWQTSVAAQPNAAPHASTTQIFDTLIVGAGITGLTTALLLQQKGHQCIVADAHSPGYGTTGGTSAHINTFADTTFAEIESDFGQEEARQFATAIAESVALIHSMVQKHGIDCDFEWKQGYVYAETDQETQQLDDLYQSALRAGVAAEPAPGARPAVVYATHIPPGGINVLHFRNAPYRSYVIAATLKEDAYPDALIYDMQDPYHYFRTHTIDGQKYLVAGGHDHKTAHGDPAQSFADLID